VNRAEMLYEILGPMGQLNTERREFIVRSNLCQRLAFFPLLMNLGIQIADVCISTSNLVENSARSGESRPSTIARCCGPQDLLYSSWPPINY
jgi:hypothetical protein